MAPGPMAGSAAQAKGAVKLALEAMQKALPGLPMGDQLHTAVLKAIADISKHFEPQEGDQSAALQQMAQAAAAQRNNPAGPPAMFRPPAPNMGAGAPPPPPPGA